MTPTETARIGVLTFENDLHALAVRAELEDNFGARVHIFETPVPNDGLLNWEAGPGGPPCAVLRDDRGEEADLSQLAAVWLRRLNQPQVFHPHDPDDVSAMLINGSWRRSTLGAFLTAFKGKWINDPQRTMAAENKLFQLDMAQQAGFTVPRTLVSQDPERVRSFCSEVGGEVVVKAVSAVRRKALVAVRCTLDDLQDDAAIAACPSIYQELIAGTDHLRVLAFGDQVLGVRIESDDLDWRRDLNIPFERTDLAAGLARRFRVLLDAMGLEMPQLDFSRIRPAKAPYEHDSPKWEEYKKRLGIPVR